MQYLLGIDLGTPGTKTVLIVFYLPYLMGEGQESFKYLSKLPK